VNVVKLTFTLRFMVADDIRAPRLEASFLSKYACTAIAQ
jgi:hypothetical protein